MPAAYVISALRTAGGRRGGALSGWHPADMGARLLEALVADSGIDASAIDDVIIGCVSQVGEQSFHIARNCVLASSLPESVPAVTIDRQCGSSQQALQFAAQAVMSGTQDLVIAGGVESMSRVPMGSPTLLAAKAGIGEGPWPRSITERYGVRQFSQFTGAEMMAQKYGLDREALDAFALESHARAAAAREGGAFAAEILPLAIAGDDGEHLHLHDEGIRAGTTLEALAALAPLVEGGVITAGNASQIADGASGLLIASEFAVRAHGLTPLARIDHVSVSAGDPVLMLDEPIRATRLALDRSGRRLDEIDLYEVNEAFAPVPLGWRAAMDADPARLNVHGGAIALGHPLGASGTRIAATLVHALRARGARLGLQTMCEGGGQANVTIFEAL